MAPGEEGPEGTKTGDQSKLRDPGDHSLYLKKVYGAPAKHTWRAGANSSRLKTDE